MSSHSGIIQSPIMNQDGAFLFQEILDAPRAKGEEIQNPMDCHDQKTSDQRRQDGSGTVNSPRKNRSQNKCDHEIKSAFAGHETFMGDFDQEQRVPENQDGGANDVKDGQFFGFNANAKKLMKKMP